MARASSELGTQFVSVGKYLMAGHADEPTANLLSGTPADLSAVPSRATGWRSAGLPDQVTIGTLTPTWLATGVHTSAASGGVWTETMSA